jgi:hypothetical protein
MHGGHVGPVTTGRIARGPLSWTRPHCGMPFVAGLRLVRNKRRVPLPVLFLLAQLLQRRLQAKGGAFAFAPTLRIFRVRVLGVGGKGRWRNGE